MRHAPPHSARVRATYRAQQAFTIAQARYRGGIGTYLELLDAQRSLFNAQITLVQDERQYLVSTVDLFRALGGGWDVTPR